MAIPEELQSALERTRAAVAIAREKDQEVFRKRKALDLARHELEAAQLDALQAYQEASAEVFSFTDIVGVYFSQSRGTNGGQ